MNNSTLNLNLTEAFNSTTPHIGLVSFLFLSLFSTNILCGLPTHICVIWHIVTASESGIASEFFTLNLSVCEIGICLTCFLKILAVWFSGLKGLVFFCQGLLVTGRPLFQSLICVERYLAVVHPVTFLKYKPLRYRLMCSAVAWIFCFGSCLSGLLLGIYLNAISVHTWLCSIQSFLFLSTQLFCCQAVLRALKQSPPGERGREREEENNMKRRAFNIILISTLSMIFIYISFTFTGLYSIMTEQYSEDPLLVSFVFFVFAGLVQPVLYLHRAGKLSFFCSPLNL